jgi:hypothetical protein
LLEALLIGKPGFDGLRMGGVYQWPGAVHEGRGKCQPFVNERADDKQREAAQDYDGARH